VRFIEDASRGITPEGVAAAIEEMRAHGIAIVNSAEVLAG
jgi:nicotinamidase/pyrazinamidase